MTLPLSDAVHILNIPEVPKNASPEELMELMNIYIDDFFETVEPIDYQTAEVFITNPEDSGIWVLGGEDIEDGDWEFLEYVYDIEKGHLHLYEIEDEEGQLLDILNEQRLLIRDIKREMKSWGLWEGETYFAYLSEYAVSHMEYYGLVYLKDGRLASPIVDVLLSSSRTEFLRALRTYVEMMHDIIVEELTKLADEDPTRFLSYFAKVSLNMTTATFGRKRFIDIYSLQINGYEIPDYFLVDETWGDNTESYYIHVEDIHGIIWDLRKLAEGYDNAMPVASRFLRLSKI